MRALLFGLLLLMVATACRPNISGLDPVTGPEWTLVLVSGDVSLTSVLWDAGTSKEVSLPAGFLGGYMFNVPGGASQGAHNVQLVRSGHRGNVVQFTVTAPLPPAAPPRLDRVGLIGTTFPSRSNNKVMTWLYVQGANFDVGALVLVDDYAVPTIAQRGLRNDLLGVTTATYPIYHYLALLAGPGERAAGGTIAVRVCNQHGWQPCSNVVSYVLPTSAATLDSDGDDIPDEWERHGYDADGDGVIDVDLPALGADPYRPVARISWVR